jgi:ATP synthase F1 gamma subunit
VKLSELKKAMRFNRELQSLVETLKNIASAHYHSMEREKERFERFMESFHAFFRVVADANVHHPLIHNESDVLGIVGVTSDFGFMGGLNAGIIENMFRVQGTRPDDKVNLIIMGEKGAAKLADVHRQFKAFKGVEQSIRYEQALEMTEYLVREVLEGRIGSLVLVYPKSLSFTRQVIETARILPCAELFEHSARAPAPAKMGLAEKSRSVIIESTFDRMAEYLARTWVTAKLYEVFEDSKLSEFGARALHLEESQQKIERDQKKLQHAYFRATHEKIDKGMRECFSAGNVRKKRKAEERTAQLESEARAAAAA